MQFGVLAGGVGDLRFGALFGVAVVGSSGSSSSMCCGSFAKVLAPALAREAHCPGMIRV